MLSATSLFEVPKTGKDGVQIGDFVYWKYD